jgi:succinoglycan biosynthesis transport protein ExoP
MQSQNPIHAQSPVQPAGDIQLAALWGALKRSFKGLLLTSALVGGVTWGVQSLMAPRFTSESQIEFSAKRNNPFPDQGDRQGATDQAARLDQAAINTHARALMSSDLLLKVAGDLKLRNRAEFNSALGPVDTWSGLLRIAGIGGPLPGETEDERVLATLRRQLIVAAIKDTRWIGISFSSTDNRLAADFANALADTYRGSLVDQPIEETSRVVEALQPKVEQLRREVLQAEAAVESYRAQSGQFKAGPTSTPLNDQRMAGLQDELLKSEAARNEAEARWRTARELVRAGSAEVLPDVQKSQLVQALIQQRVRLERQIAESSATLLGGHPRMRQLNADLGGLKGQIASEVQKVVQSIEKDQHSAMLRVDSVKRQIAELKTTVVAQTGNEARLNELQSFARAKRTELERLQKQLEDNRTVVNIRQVPIEAQIISRAIPSSVATWPRKGPSTVLASAAAFILGLAFVITRALISAPMPGQMPHSSLGGYPATGPARPRSLVEPLLRETPEPEAAPVQAPPAAARPLAPAPVSPIRTVAATNDPLPPVPTVRPGDRSAAVAARDAREAPATLHDLAGRLMSRKDTSAGVRTLVAGDKPGIDALGKAKELAELLSGGGKHVLLVNWSLSGQRRRATDNAPGTLGMCDLIAGTASFEQVIKPTPGSLVHVIGAGSAPQDERSVLDSDRLNLTLDALDEAYDQVVVAAGHRDAKLLFEAIEGRFDAAVVVTAKADPAAAGRSGPDNLLGFEVTDIDTIHVPAGDSVQNRISQILVKPAQRIGLR